MRKTFLLITAISILAFNAGAQEGKGTNKAGAQQDIVLPYKKFPTLPAFNIRLMDSATIFNTYTIPEGNPIALFFFDPECSHCQAVTKELLKEMDKIKEIQFYMITPVHSASALRKYYNDYHLSDYKNIIMAGRDFEYFFGSYYGIKYVPDLALYDSHKKLIGLFEGAITAKELNKAIH